MAAAIRYAPPEWKDHFERSRSDTIFGGELQSASQRGGSMGIAVHGQHEEVCE